MTNRKDRPSRLSKKIAAKLIYNGWLGDTNPEDWYIERTRSGRHQLDAGTFVSSSNWSTGMTIYEDMDVTKGHLR